MTKGVGLDDRMGVKVGYLGCRAHPKTHLNPLSPCSPPTSPTPCTPHSTWVVTAAATPWPARMRNENSWAGALRTR